MSDATLNHWLNQASKARKRKVDLVDSALLELGGDDLSPERKQELINLVCEANLQLVGSVVNKFVKHKSRWNWNHDKTLDLLQEGYFGLRRSVEKFDVSMGRKFSTYATIWINQAIRRYCAINQSLIYVPENTLAEIFYIKKHGVPSGSPHRPKSLQTLALAQQALTFESLDARVGGEGSPTLGEITPNIRKTRPLPEGAHTWATRMLDDKLAEAGIGGFEADLIRAYAKVGTKPGAIQRVKKENQKQSMRILNEALDKLKAIA